MDSPGIGRKFQGILRCIVIGFAFGLAACGGGDGDDDQGGNANTQPAPPGIGTAGGTVLGPTGSKVEIPSGALAVVTQIAVAQTSSGAPPLPPGLTPIGQMFAFTPHGTAFAVPATVTMPFDPASVPAGRTPALFKTNAQNQWVKVANAIFGASSVSGQVTSFSNFQAVAEDPELLSATAKRTYTFSELINTSPGPGGDQLLLKGPEIVSFGTDLIDKHEFGPANFDRDFDFFDGTRLEKDDIAHGIVAAALDGKTLQVATEAPRANANVVAEVVGSETELIHEQTFLKEKADARLSFTVPLAAIETHDENAILGRRCEGFDECDFILGSLKVDVEAHTFDSASTQFFHVSGIATLSGFADNWRRNAHTVIGSRVPLWNNDDFAFAVSNDPNGFVGSQARLALQNPRTFPVDLSEVDVGTTFSVKITANAHAHNSLGGPPSELPTAAGAYINFEDLSGIGSLFVTDGLKQVEPPAADDPPPLVFPPVACPGGVNPAAGVLQFSEATYTSPERDTPPTVTITRTGGSSGVVSANFATIGGTAIGGSDFEPVNVTVFFGDGDTEPRVVEIPIIEDTDAEGDETVEMELSQPGGCVRIGVQDTAILTILDDDAPPPPSGLDPTFDGDGKAALEDFGGDRSGMAVQSDGKVIMVGGRFTDWLMARFNADGSLDTSFGSLIRPGTVTTDMVPNKAEESLAVTVQADGKIVVAGYSGLVIALARYNSDGSLDDTFGSGGKVISGVTGRAFAVAIDGNDRIVVAGDVLKSNPTDPSDFVVARFNANGGFDPTFGSTLGFTTTDIGKVANEAHGLKVLADNSLLVSGFAPIVVSSVNGGPVTQSAPQGAVVRYLSNGIVDPAFGAVALPGDNVGRGMALQSDGKIVLAGSIDIATFPATDKRFALIRLNANGTIDETFGTLGRVQTSITGRGDAALAVAVQADDKIVAAGAGSAQLNSNFALARYDRNGNLDTSFNQDGSLTIDFFGFTDIAENIVIQSNGKIVVGGLALHNFDGYGVARVLP